MTIETRLFIDNQFVESKSGKTFPIYNPFTEEKVADVSEAFAEDINDSVKAAQRGFPDWKEKSAFEHVEYCLKLAELIQRDASQLATLDAMSMGMSITFNQNIIQISVMSLRHDCGTRYMMFLSKVIPCVLAGNTIVLKSSEKSPPSSIHLAGLCKAAGFPAGVVNVITGFGPNAGAPLAEHMDIRKLSFTGSTRTGKIIAAAGAKSNLKTVTLENGGKSPAIVFEDADIDRAVAECAQGVLMNSGQVCVADARIYAPFGDPMDPNTMFDPQADKAQFDSVLRYIVSGRSQGANPESGGQRATTKGYHVQLTIFTNVTEDAKLMKEEIFGPVAAIQTFATEEEVVSLANDTNYGLHAASTLRTCPGHYAWQRLVKLVVSVNTSWAISAYDLPMGGYKTSGQGREGGKKGLEAWFEVKTISIAL